MLGMELLCKVRRVWSASEISGKTKVSNIIPWWLGFLNQGRDTGLSQGKMFKAATALENLGHLSGIPLALLGRYSALNKGKAIGKALQASCEQGDQRKRWEAGEGITEVGFNHKQVNWLGTVSTPFSHNPYLQWSSGRCGILVSSRMNLSSRTGGGNTNFYKQGPALWAINLALLQVLNSSAKC